MLKIEKSTMEAMQYLYVCFNRGKVQIDTGGYDREVYKRGLFAFLQVPFASEFTVVMPDGTEKKFVEVKSDEG